MIPWRGRRIACVLVANEILAWILRGEGDRCLSSAPADLIVVAATTIDAQRIGIYVESESFEPVNDRGAVPVLDVVFTTVRNK